MSHRVQFVAIVVKEPDTSYWSTVPGFGVCYGVGETIEEAKAGLPDALAFHIQGMREQGLPMPTPRGRDEVLAEIDDHVVADYLIEVDLPAPCRPAGPARGR